MAPMTDLSCTCLVAFPVSEYVDSCLELAGVNECPQDVVAEVAEAQGDPTQVLEPSADGFDCSVAGAHIEVGEELPVSLPQGLAELCELGRFLGCAGADRLEWLVHRDLALTAARLLVGWQIGRVGTPSPAIRYFRPNASLR